ncbi:hypothetical protein EDD16DRAFT_1518042 [Pisolithus croceorrhizus]|nr:hypothetical protein EV401DRAFT_1895394 [Pisolithus croceorrhizus]KAI6123238.1 hypothetical protein EDD16DRAFT_1518042 [Pisolithus croceorrhizus]
MALQTSPSDPSIGARRSKRLQAAMPLQTKTQPNYGAKAHHCRVKPGTSIQFTKFLTYVLSFPQQQQLVAMTLLPRLDLHQPCPWCPSQGLTGKEHKGQYLDSFRTKIVVLKDGTKLDHCTALEQLHRGTITIQDIEDEDSCDQSGPLESPLDSHLPSESQDMFNDHDTHEQFIVSPVPPSENVFQDQSSQSEEDKWEVESGMQSEHPEDFDQVEVNHTSDAENGPAEDTMDTEDADQYRKSKKSSCILTMASKDSDLAKEDVLAAIKKAQALGMHTAGEAQAIADEFGKTLASIMAAAGLMTKETWAESVWNMHQAWCALLDPDLVIEDMKDYHCCQMKHYESHKDKEEFPDLWVEICKFWSKSISGSNNMSLKGMAQTWCNVENIHIFGCVIYSGNDEAAHQAQGIFAGSSLCMQLPSERQTDIARLLDYLATIIKYKVLDLSVNVPLPTFSMLSGISYDHILALKLLESTWDRNQQVLPLVVMHKLCKPILVSLVILSHKAVADKLVFPAISCNFNVKHLTADELHALTVPFLKEWMGKDYEMEAMVDDEDDHVSCIDCGWLYWLAKMQYSDQLALVCMMNLKAFDIPLVINTFGRPLHLLSDSQAFLNVVPRVAVTHQPHTLTTMTIISYKSAIRSIMRIKKDPPQWSMSIAVPLIRDVTATPLMKRTIPAGTMPTTEGVGAPW